MIERRVVLNTGASSGIGAASAFAFADRGWQVVLGARRESRLADVAGRIRDRNHVKAPYTACDVRCEDQVQRLLGLAAEHFGRLDAIVCSAGKGFYARVDETPADTFRDLLETNVIGTHNTVRAAAPLLSASGHGHVVLLGSVVGKVAWPVHGPYAATKSGVAALAQAMRAELAPSECGCRSSCQ